jgi:hypothetical protein
VDANPATGDSFESIMHLLKRTEARHNEAPHPEITQALVRAEFMSSEERLRLIREDAKFHCEGRTLEAEQPVEEQAEDLELEIKIDIFVENATLFLTVKSISTEAHPEYQIVNLSPSHCIGYKQKGIAGNRWKQIRPGRSKSYFWENPLLTRQTRSLMVQLGKNELVEQEFGNRFNLPGKSSINETSIEEASQQMSQKSDRSNVSIQLDNIGQEACIETNDPALGRLMLRVYIKGPTKILEIIPEHTIKALAYSRTMLEEQRTVLSSFKEGAIKRGHLFGTQTTDDKRLGVYMKSLLERVRSVQRELFEEALKEMQETFESQDNENRNFETEKRTLILADMRAQYQQSHLSLFGLTPKSTHQITVSIFEAKGLKTLLMQVTL